MKKTLLATTMLVAIAATTCVSHAFCWQNLNPANWGTCPKCEKPCKVSPACPVESKCDKPVKDKCGCKKPETKCDPCQKKVDECDKCKPAPPCDPCDRLQQMAD